MKVTMRATIKTSDLEQNLLPSRISKPENRKTPSLSDVSTKLCDLPVSNHTHAEAKTKTKSKQHTISHRFFTRRLINRDINVHLLRNLMRL